MMKHRYLALVWSLVCLAGGTTDVFAQDYPPVPVTISRSQVNMNGKTYYAHIVLERQTIYGITKAYGVTEEDLYAANPMLKAEGLKAGTVLYVPVVSGQKENARTPVVNETAAKTEKTVKEKPVKTETPSEKPAVTREKPVVVDTKPVPVVDEDGFIQHTVKWFEDIYDVAKAYGVTADQIMTANGMKSSRISKRQTLRIPYTDQAKASLASAAPATAEPKAAQPERADVEPAVPVVETPVVEKAEPLEKDEEEPVEGLLDRLVGNGKVDIALVLPFNAAGKYSESNMDFYTGVLMALRDLEREGVKSTLNVFDLQAGVPASYELSKNDFVLGPISTADLTTILGVTGGQVPVVSPLDQRAGDLAESHDGFIQAPSSTASQYAELAAWAKEDSERGDKIILMTEKTTNGSTAAATGVRNALVDDGTTFDGVSLSTGEARSLSASLTSRLTKGGVNRIIVASEKETFVGDVVRNVGILLGRGYKIVLYAPSRVRTFETIDGSAYHQDDLHICSPYFADYESDSVKSFVRTYRALYRTEPSQFAFQGYDLARYFANLCAKYGDHWTRALDQVTGSGIHTDFRFVKVRRNSWRNTGIRRIVYNPDYTTELVR